MKIKPLTKEQIIISTDRLTRFKEPETKYLRVFKDIISNNLLEPKYKKSELDNMSYTKLRDLAEYIINKSLNNIENNSSINKKLLEYELSVFNISNSAKELLNNNINYSAISDILPDDIPNNLIYLKYLACKCENKSVFPVKKVVLCEGITEEILLPKFAEICGYDFNKNGIYVVSAGGKNQVVKYFYNYAETLKIPVFVLLDNDATENYAQISPKLRKIDKIHLLKSGEFEDLLPHSLIIKTLKSTTENISLPMENIGDFTSNVEFLKEFYRHRGMHEFKKSEFAKSVKDNIVDISDISDEIMLIFSELQT